MFKWKIGWDPLYSRGLHDWMIWKLNGWTSGEIQPQTNQLNHHQPQGGHQSEVQDSQQTYDEYKVAQSGVRNWGGAMS